MFNDDDIFDIDVLPVAETNYGALPEGWYDAVINKVEKRETKDGTGAYLAVRYDITGPTSQGRVVFGNINIRNKSDVAQRIGQEALGNLMRACGLTKASADQFVGSQIQIKLTVRKQEGYEDSNDVRGFKALNGNSMPKPAAPAPEPTKAAPPWSKK
jgi:hypothetical protein